MLDVLDVIITATNQLADEVAKIHDSVKAKVTKEVDKLEGDQT